MTANFKLFYQNCRGLRTKIANGLRDRISLSNHNIIALTETWLNDDFTSESIFDQNLYSVYRADRNPRTYSRPNTLNQTSQVDLMGGGCLIAVDKSVPSFRMTDWEREVPYDCIWLRLNSNSSSKIFINCIYVNCRTTFELFNEYLNHLHVVINEREPNAKFLILGDFNLSCIEWYFDNNHCSPILYEGRMATELINTLTLTDLKQVNHIKNSYNKILDLCLTNSLSVKSKLANGLVNEDLYHPAILFTFDSNEIKFMKSNKHKKPNFFKADYVAINNELSSINWHILFHNKNIDDAIELFYSKILSIVSKYTPKTTFTHDKYPIWYSYELIHILNEKEFYRKQFNKTQLPIYNTLFYEKRKQFKKLKKKCLRDYAKNIESYVRTNPKSFFAYTKSLQKSNNLPMIMKYNGLISDNMKQTADLFANYFESVYAPTSNHTNFQCNNDCHDYIPISEEEIQNIITSLDRNKISSPDGLPIIFYKNTILNIVKPLSLLFTLSTRQMKYPSKWKISHVSPIFKAGDKADVKNYRPISVLSAAAKIFDRILHNYLLSKTAHLISASQHGFTAGKSTTTNLLEYVNYIATNMMNGGRVDVIFMDLAKAFDKIIHEILLNKLSTLPLNPCFIVLLESYLSERQQIVCINGEKSNSIHPKSSVPQGSVLSPLLFALFINDLPPLISSQILLFADDLKIFRTIKSLEDTRRLQNDINTIHNWCAINKLEINTSKCNSISFTRKTHCNLHQSNYNINGVALIQVNSIRDLGIIFDSRLSFESHIKNITSRAYKILGFISRSLKKFRDIGTYLTLYNTYVRTILDHGSTVWSPFYDIHIKSIERVQRRFTRILFRKFHYPTESYGNRLLRLELTSLENRRLLFDELTLYKIHNGIYRTSLNQFINIRNPMRFTRLAHTFYLPFVNNNVEYFTPILRLQRQHNETFNNIDINEVNFNAFKRYVGHEIKIIQLNSDY